MLSFAKNSDRHASIVVQKRSPSAPDREIQTVGNGVSIGLFLVEGYLDETQTSLLYQMEDRLTLEMMHQVIVPLLTQENGISLRSIDWLVTNFSKSRNIYIGRFCVHRGYKSMLGKYHRQNYDPFRRSRDGKKGCVSFQSGDRTYHTTVGQLCFFLWAHENHVLTYLKGNINQIEQDMNKRSSRRNRLGGGRRQQLSKICRGKCAVFCHTNTPTDQTQTATEFNGTKSDGNDWNDEEEPSDEEGPDDGTGSPPRDTPSDTPGGCM